MTISYPQARRASPNEARDIARKELADSLRAMRRSGYNLPDMEWTGHVIARAQFRAYRAGMLAINRMILREALRRGETIQ